MLTPYGLFEAQSCLLLMVGHIKTSFTFCGLYWGLRSIYCMVTCGLAGMVSLFLRSRRVACEVEGEMLTFALLVGRRNQLKVLIVLIVY